MRYEVKKDVGAYRAGQCFEWARPPILALSAIRAGFIEKMPATGGVVTEPLVVGESAPPLVLTLPKKRGRPKRVVDVADIPEIPDGALGF